MEIITWNINGYRSADKQGYIEKLMQNNHLDIICFQEIKMNTELDVMNYKTNYKNNMFTEDERKLIDKLLHIGFIDSFRHKTKKGDIYSWWPNAFNARERNMGWRIDYIFASKQLANNIKSAEYLKSQLGSDHCPFKISLDI